MLPSASRDIKILVNAIGIDQFRQQVETEWTHIRESDLRLSDQHIQGVVDSFRIHQYRDLPVQDKSLKQILNTNPVFATWYHQNTRSHKNTGYRIVYLSLKDHGLPPGDITDEQLESVATLAERYSMGEIRTTYSQNLVFAQVEQSELYQLWRELNHLKLASPNIATAKDIICCPGFDFCALANATSIDISEDIMRRFDKLNSLHLLGDIRINISGCMNACGHHHVGHIGILGVDKKGEDWYQITLGGSASNHTSLGKVLGPSVAKANIGEAVEAIIHTYVDYRNDGESFLQTLGRIGRDPFKENVYAHAN